MRRADRRAFALAYGAWLFGIFAFFIPAATWNPVSRFNLTRAVVERGSLTVDPYWTSTGDRARVGGHWYSDKPPVVAIAAVPAYAIVRTTQRLRGVQPDYQSFTIGRTPAARVIPNRAFTQGLYVCSLMTSGVAGVALALLLFRFLLRRVRTSAAFLGSCLAVLGTSIFPYATSFYGHVPSAALILGAIYALDPLGSRPRGAPPSRRRVLVAGACISLAAGAEYLTAVPGALVLLSYLVWTEPKLRAKTFLNLVLGGLLPALLVAAYHTAIFGAPWRTGYSFEDQAAFATGHSSGFMGIHVPTLAGIWGLTFSVRRGLFYISPMAAVAALFAVRYAVRRRDWAVAVGVGVLVTLLLLNAGYYMWWGGASAGPRHLVPGMAFLGMGAALMLRVRHPWVRRIIVGLCVVSLANCFALTLIGIEAPESGDILRQFVWPRFRVANLAHAGGATNLGMRLGLSGPVSVVVLMVWTIGGFFYLYRKATQVRARPSDA
jgi:hypothetical protein